MDLTTPRRQAGGAAVVGHAALSPEPILGPDASTSSATMAKRSLKALGALAKPPVGAHLESEPEPECGELLAQRRGVEPIKVAMSAALGLLVALEGIRERAEAPEDRRETCPVTRKVR